MIELEQQIKIGKISKLAMLMFVFHNKLGSSANNMRAEMSPYPIGELMKSLIRLDVPCRI